jgi:membrane associated rhomboid family serine protease
VTALTLHVDLVHVLGNAIATALLLPPIIRRLGPGVGLGLVLLAGAAGNLLAAAVQGPRHVAVGASTATFGALGILAALRLGSSSPAGRQRGRRWIVPVASVLLLAMLGTGPGTDVIAHALGLVAGAALGRVAAIVRQPVAAPIQRALVAAVALAVLGCWCAALAGRAG